jgi:uncharacterized damage-inducible protein DinB
MRDKIFSGAMSVFSNPAQRSVDQAQAYTKAVLDLLGSRDPIEVLSGTAAELSRLITGLSPEQMAHPEAPGRWSIAHVLQHLADSELVWGYRVRMVLAHDRPVITGYDQDLWADRLGYARADAQQAIADFGVLRAANLRLLSHASAADLARVGVHAERGEESVSHMMKLYAGHDVLHVRQLQRIRTAVLERPLHPRIREILTCLDVELETLRAAVDAVPPARRGERPAADRWSVAEVLEHLAMVEEVVLKACSRQLDAARAAGLPRETDGSSVLQSLPPERVANREQTLVAPDRLQPKGLDASVAWANIESTRARFNDFVRSCDGLALGHVSFPHPAFGPLNLYQWLLFAAGHHARHAAQIREIAAQLR